MKVCEALEILNIKDIQYLTQEKFLSMCLEVKQKFLTNFKSSDYQKLQALNTLKDNIDGYGIFNNVFGCIVLDADLKEASELQQVLKKELWKVFFFERGIEKRKFSILEMSIKGIPISLGIQKDQKDDMPFLSLISFLTSLLLFSFLGSITNYNGIFFSLYLLIFIPHMFFSFLAFIPLSRFWLPLPLVKIIMKSLEIGAFFFKFLMALPLVNIVVGLASIVLRVVTLIISIIFYYFIDITVGTKRPKITKLYFAGFSREYIRKLINKNATSILFEDFVFLRYLSEKLSEVSETRYVKSWFFSSKNLRVKTQTLIAVLLICFASYLFIASSIKTSNRNTAYIGIIDAQKKEKNLEVIQLIEKFLKNAPLKGKDKREKEVIKIYHEVFVKWFVEKEDELTKQEQTYIENYKLLVNK